MSPSSDREINNSCVESNPVVPSPVTQHFRQASLQKNSTRRKIDSLHDDFQIISQNHLLASINMKANDNPKLPTVNKSKIIVKNAQNSHEVNSKKLFSPGCGHNECAHCDNDQNTSEASSPPPPPPLPHHSSHPLHPPPLPPKPPWMRSSITRPRPLSYNETSSETTETSEHETVIYSKNVKLNNGKNSISEVNLSSQEASIKSSSRPISKQKDVRRKIPVSQKSSTMDLHSLMLEKYMREKVNRRTLLCERLSKINQDIDNIRVRLISSATTRESEKFNLFVQDTEKVTCLMYSLACRLAKTENILETFGPADKQLEKKRDKLKSQLEEAKYLNKLVTNRAPKILLILQKYLGDTSLVVEFKACLEEKLKIIVELKELDDKVCLSSVKI